jgi:subtilisin family serine protease
LEHDEVAFDGGAYLVSWNQIAHNVPEAWEISRGRGVTVGVIDTGVSNNQTLLGDLFNRYHVGKRITKGFTHSEHNSPNDTCGHGTTICGQIAGPLNRERAIVGIAYEANLYSIKVGNGVLLSEQKRINAVVEAMRIFSNNPQVKIINISMGSLTSKGKIKDAVNQAYARQKLIVAAAGYKIGSVVRGTYPARYDNVLAATGSLFDAANPNNLESFSDGNPTGRFVDFAAYLRRRVDDDSALGMNRAGFQVRRARGSSSAAANVAGIAALVWSARPQLNRDQVRRILIDAASNRNGISNQFGWGIIDARRAVELAVDFNIPMSVQLNGPREITSSGTQRWTTSVRNAEGSISYRWFWNGQQVSTSSSYSRYVAVSGGITQNRLRLEVTTSTGQNVSFTEIIYSNGSGINI